jgi:pimeloyl-ACP methyl ester carboxylesterase
MKLVPYLAAILLNITALSVSASGEDIHSAETAGSDKEKVILLHGLGRSAAAMWLLGSRIAQGGFEVVQIEYDSLGATPKEILDSVKQQIETCCGNSLTRVHFVGHSLGGLISRAYLAEWRPKHLGSVVLIATPNSGTPLVDKYRESWLMKLAGPTAITLGTDPESFPNSLPAPDYPVGVIAGVATVDFFDDEDLPGADDGLVPLDSAKLDGMMDFVIVEWGHSLLRYSREVARQTIAFLRTGAFDHRY